VLSEKAIVTKLALLTRSDSSGGLHASVEQYLQWSSAIATGHRNHPDPDGSTTRVKRLVYNND
jgi:hypothetical protein